MLAEQAKLKILQQLATKPDSSQRELAKALDISLGSVNYCLHALVEKGCIKKRNFQNKHNKLAYAYFLTPAGSMEKMRLTKYFLERKTRECDALHIEIEALRTELKANAEAVDDIVLAGA